MLCVALRVLVSVPEETMAVEVLVALDELTIPGVSPRRAAIVLLDPFERGSGFLESQGIRLLRGLLLFVRLWSDELLDVGGPIEWSRFGVRGRLPADDLIQPDVEGVRELVSGLLEAPSSVAALPPELTTEPLIPPLFRGDE